mmetsp:Transcript_19455/g.35241  ORF Transcript_19455/g.35241 Transcript_19455/m.35241 type:complete len:125 (-) Transcript_19455:1770-2144(-)
MLSDDVVVKPIPPSFNISREAWYVVDKVTMDGDPSEEPESDISKNDALRMDDAPNNETIYNLTIVGPDLMALNISESNTVTGTVYPYRKWRAVCYASRRCRVGRFYHSSDSRDYSSRYIPHIHF